MLNENRFHPFHFQHVQASNPVLTILSLCIFDSVRCSNVPEFLGQVLFTEEATIYARVSVMRTMPVCGQPIIHMQRDHMCVNDSM